MTDPLARSAQGDSGHESLAERLRRVWREGQGPDVYAFLVEAGELAPAQVAEVLLVDQRQRWQAGERVPAEAYLERYPAVRADPEAALDLVYHEFLLREERGEYPTLEEFARRFPDQADRLRVQVELHWAMPTLPPRHAGDSEADIQPADGWPVVPGYEILGELGRGGMGVVYQARQTRLGRVVALKMILAGGHADESERVRFRSEAEAVARLQHPNIVQIFEIGESQGSPFFSLEFVAGGSLDRHLAGTPQQPLDAARLVETLARAMQHAHEKGIVHRDLKPANVLLTGEGAPDTVLRTAVPKITDFGLAKKLDQSAGPTATGAILGTPSYMAPEQAGGKPREVGPAADIYALGAILYECLTGRPPFKAATSFDTLLQVLSDEPLRPSLLQPKLPRDLETVCLKCLEKEPARRYATAQQLADDLRRFLDGDPVQARRAGPVVRVARWVGKQRRSLVLTATAAAMTALLLLVIPLAWRWHQQSRSGYLSLFADVAVPVTAEVLDEDGVDALWRFPLPTSAPVSFPAGSYTLRLSSPGEMSETLQVLVEAREHSEFPLKAAGRFGTRPLKPPEGFKRVWPVANLQGGGRAALVGAREGSIMVEKKNDRGLVVAREMRGGCEVVMAPADGGPPLWTYLAEKALVLDGSEGMRKPPLLCQTDGKAVLIVSFNGFSDNKNQVHALDATTGKRLWHFRCPEDARDLAVVPSRGRLLVVCPAGDRFLLRDARTGEPAGPDLVLPSAQPQKLLPTFASLGPGRTSAAFVFREGVLPAPSTLSAVDLETGQTIWDRSWQCVGFNPGLDLLRSSPGSRPGGLLATNLTEDGRVTVLQAIPRQEGNETLVVVQALDGLTGEEHWQHAVTKRWLKFSFGSLQLIEGPDLDGDGWRDVFVASLFNGELFVDALSGKDGRVLWWRRYPLVRDSQRFIVFPRTIGSPCWWGVGADGQARLVIPVFVRRMQGGIDLMEWGIGQALGMEQIPEAQLFVLSAGDGKLHGFVREAGLPGVADLNGDGLPDLFWAQKEDSNGDASFDLFRAPQAKWRFVPGMPLEAWRRLPPSIGVPSSLFYQAGLWKPDMDQDSDGVPDLYNAGAGRRLVISGRTGALISWGDRPATRSHNISRGMDKVRTNNPPPLEIARTAEGGSESVVWERSGSTVSGRSRATRKPIWRCAGPGEPEAVLMPSQASEPPRVLFRLADKTLVCILALPTDPEGRYRPAGPEPRSYPAPPADPRHERSLPWRPDLLEFADFWPGSRNPEEPLIEWLTRAEVLPAYLAFSSLLFALVYLYVPFALARLTWRRQWSLLFAPLGWRQWSLLLALLPLIWLGLALRYTPAVPFFGGSRFGFFGESWELLLEDHGWLVWTVLNVVFILLGLGGLMLLGLLSWLVRNLRQGQWRWVMLLLGGWAVLTLASGALWLDADVRHRAEWEHYAWRYVYLLPLLWLYPVSAVLLVCRWISSLVQRARSRTDRRQAIEQPAAS
jgi:serine/threonine-protein kinase